MGPCRQRLSFALILAVLLVSGCRSSGSSFRNSAGNPSAYQPAVPQQETAALSPDATNASSTKVDIDAHVYANPFRTASRSKELIESDATETSSDAQENVESPDNTSVVGMSLAQLNGMAVSQNPDLVTLRQSERVSMAAKGVADTYPFNPFLQVQATPFQDAGNGGPNNMYHYVLLMQTIQLAHQQDYREQEPASRSTVRDGIFIRQNSRRWPGTATLLHRFVSARNSNAGRHQS
ncbi:MAG: hypothetical protein U0936_23730 [Planctomycetaceae bacterium]